MINYKQLLTDFGNIALHHEQIKSFGFGDLPQITNDIVTKMEPLYTRMYIVPGNIVFNQNQITYQLSLIILDKVNNDLSNLNEVISDTLEIQKDIWNILYQSYTEDTGNFSWDLIPGQLPSVTPFLERFETILGGWTMNLSVQIAFDYDRCTPPVIDGYGFPQEEEFKSYKLILDDFQEFATLHEQIHSYGFGDVQQMTNDIITKQEPKYPRMYVNPNTSAFAHGEIQYGFNIYFIDRLDNDLTNQQDVLSDTLELAKDFYSKLYLSDFEAQWNAQLLPFFERTETGVGGWLLSVTSTQKSDYNRCVLPVTSFSPGVTWEQLMELWKLEAQKWDEVKKQN